ncbi:MAG: FAD-dependent thymidylate synthase [Rickettsiales bacterium]|nr:FAD-dependent thymidylate synthase [Rickettsiales bacterium]
MKNAIKTQDFDNFTTKRATVTEIDDLLYKQFPVLDKGFVRVVDYMGSDQSIVQSARVSYGQGTKKLRQDQGLINYLMRHRHTTPFEMCEIKFHIKLPIFIARQWIRHRTANVNEYSARYSVLGKEFYVPSRENLCTQSETNKQGRAETLSDSEANRVLDIIKDDSLRCYDHYEEMLNTDQEGNVLDENKQGLTRELARMNLTLNYYTEWYWKIDLHNLLHFLALRVDSHAQYEIRMYAEAMLDIVKAWVPLAYEAFKDYRMNSFECSQKMISAINKKLKGEDLTLENSGLTKREWDELAKQFAI